MVTTAKIKEWQVVKPMIFSIKNGSKSKDLTLRAVHLLPSSATPKYMYSGAMMVKRD